MGWDGFSGLYLKFGPEDTWHKLLVLYDKELKKSVIEFTGHDRPAQP